MVWIRLLLFSTPLWVAGGAVWLVNEARDLKYTDPTAGERTELTVAIRSTERPGIFNPLAPSTGPTREITEMIFDRPFRRDDDLRLRPHLIDSWEFRRRATFYFKDEEAAEQGAAKIQESKESWKMWNLLEAVRDGKEIHVILNGQDPSMPKKIAGIFDDEWLAGMLRLRLTLKESVRESLDNFRAGSIEKGQIQHTGFESDRTANLYLLGETDLFLKELRLYYESNRNLEPSIEVLNRESIVSDLELILTLRDDVKWHDGEPLTADDLIFTFEEIARPGSAHPLRNSFAHIDRVGEIDSRTIRVELREYFAPMLESWEKLPILPLHRLKDVKTPEEWETFFREPIGTGPYKLAARNSDGGVVLEAHAEYFRGTPRQKRIEYRIVEDAEERLLKLRHGEIDLFYPDARELRWESDRRANLLRGVTRFQTFVAWNLDRPLFADKRVRQGLGQLIDLETIVEGAGGGIMRRCRGLFFPGSRFCDEEVEPSARDPEAAEALLTAAGWKKTDDGWTTAGGEPVAFRLTCDDANAVHTAIASDLAAGWRQAGIDVEIERIDWADMIGDRIGDRDFDGLMLGWELGYGRDQFEIWHSSRAKPGDSNFTGLRDQTVDKTLEKLRLEDNEEAIRKLAVTLQQQIYEFQPCLFLCESGPVIGCRTGGVRISRPRSDGEWSDDPVSVGRAGLHPGRPWWVRIR